MDDDVIFQVELHTDLEGKIPRSILKYVDKTDYKVYPKCTGNIFSRVGIPTCSYAQCELPRVGP